jgi:hypothetical protein
LRTGVGRGRYARQKQIDPSSRLAAEHEYTAASEIGSLIAQRQLSGALLMDRLMRREQTASVNNRPFVFWGAKVREWSFAELGIEDAPSHAL